MGKEDIFVGREQELARFKEVLADTAGQAVVVIGHRGMGKTWLINRMAAIAEKDSQLKCGSVRYEVTPTDSVDSTMALMMDHAFEAAQVTEGSFAGTTRRLEQWRAFLNVFKIGDLVMNLRRDPQRNTRDQFLERLRLISKRMPADGRAIFIIDPEKYMQPDSDQSWALVVKDLPDKIKLVFAQRTEDVLVNSDTFNSLANVVNIPEDWLNVLEEKAVDELLDLRAQEASFTITQLREALSSYEGHPYALQAALDLVKDGTKLEDLPPDPTPLKIAKAQWKQVAKKGPDAISLLEAYAILEVAVSDEVVESVSGLKPVTRKGLLADDYLAGLTRKEADDRRIYHAILADYILDQISEDDKTKYHRRAVDIYRKRLTADVKPDALAAVRLSEHVLAAEGQNAFIKVCAYETWIPLRILGLLDTAIGLANRALKMVEKGSADEASLRCTLGIACQIKGNFDDAERMHLSALEISKQAQHQRAMAREYGNLGLIYRRQGDLEKAEEMHKKSLQINEKKESFDNMATDYGNLGSIYLVRDNLDKAEEMYKKALEIDERIGHTEGVARHNGNLGLIYRTRGDLDKAEELHKKALEFMEKLGWLQGMANQYSGLGSVYEKRGDKEQVRQYWEKARDLFEKIGIPNEVKKIQEWLDELGE